MSTFDIFVTAAEEFSAAPRSLFAARLVVTFARDHARELGLSSDVATVLHEVCLRGDTEGCSESLRNIASAIIRLVSNKMPSLAKKVDAWVYDDKKCARCQSPTVPGSSLCRICVEDDLRKNN